MAHNILCGLKIGHISNLKITGVSTALPAPPVLWGQESPLQALQELKFKEKNVLLLLTNQYRQNIKL